jgi:hypothetical protein
MSEVAGYQNRPPRGFRPLDSITEQRMLRLWQAGKDTYEIAAQLSIPEPQVYIVLPRLRAEHKGNQ